MPFQTESYTKPSSVGINTLVQALLLYRSEVGHYHEYTAFRFLFVFASFGEISRSELAQKMLFWAFLF